MMIWRAKNRTQRIGNVRCKFGRPDDSAALISRAFVFVVEGSIDTTQRLRSKQGFRGGQLNDEEWRTL